MRGEGVGSLGCRRGVTDFSLEDDFPKAAPLVGGQEIYYCTCCVESISCKRNLFDFDYY